MSVTPKAIISGICASILVLLVAACGEDSTVAPAPTAVAQLEVKAAALTHKGSGQAPDSGTDAGSRGITLVVNPLVIRLPLEGVVDLSAEESRLQGELDGSLKNLQRVETLVSNPNFKAKAKPEVVENEEERLRSLREEIQRLEEILAQLSAD